MPPIEFKSKEAGVTLVETMIGIVISGIIAVGGYQMMTRSQKFLAYKQLDQTSKNEISELVSVIKKDWDFRLRKTDRPPSVPAEGFSLLTATDTPCVNNSNCPKIRLWINRKINGVVILDKVTIENTCRRPTDQRVVTMISTLDFAAKVNTDCSTCPTGQIPVVTIVGVNADDNQVLLAAENRIFPQNTSDLTKVNPDGILGMQACFSQASADSPLSIDIRSLHRDQSSNLLKTLQRTQVLPLSNFAGIQLEQ